MPGQMGGEQRTMTGVWVYKVDASRGLVWVRGQVPGHAGGWLFVKDDPERRQRGDPAMRGLPFPTRTPAEAAALGVEAAASDRPIRKGTPLSF